MKSQKFCVYYMQTKIFYRYAKRATTFIHKCTGMYPAHTYKYLSSYWQKLIIYRGVYFVGVSRLIKKKKVKKRNINRKTFFNKNRVNILEWQIYSGHTSWKVGRRSLVNIFVCWFSSILPGRFNCQLIHVAQCYWNAYKHKRRERTNRK